MSAENLIFLVAGIILIVVGLASAVFPRPLLAYMDRAAGPGAGPIEFEFWQRQWPTHRRLLRVAAPVTMILIGSVFVASVLLE